MLARSIIRQCAALPVTYVPPHRAASSVMRVSLESSGVPVRPHVERRARSGRFGHVGLADAEELALRALALLLVLAGLVDVERLTCRLPLCIVLAQEPATRGTRRRSAAPTEPFERHALVLV